MITEANTVQTKERALKILAGSTAVCSFVLIGLTGYWHASRLAKFESTICNVTGSDFTTDSDLDVLKRLIVKNDKDTNREKACRKVSELLDELVEKIVKDKYNSDSSPEYVSPNLEKFNCKKTHSKAAELHLRNIVSHAQHAVGKATKVFWQTTLSSELEELKYLEDEGEVVVMKSGLYYVSSQLTTAVDDKNSSFHDHRPVKHLVFLVSNAKRAETIILENEKSVCEMPVRMSQLTSTTGAVFSLQEHDRIYVATSHPYNLVSGNFLSIHMI